jgi:serine/threonine protein kinase
LQWSIRLPGGEWFFDDAQRLGSPGGFGEVFSGDDGKGNTVAIKRLKVTAAQAAHRELTIAQELAGKTFQHVLAPLDSGQDANTGGYFLVMPRADGSLADEIVKRGIISEKESLDILIQIASGLQEIGQLVHRDLKPANILLHMGSWKIADFGIARFVEESTSANTVKGFLSPQFAAPEQWNGEHATGATDVYALCCIAYALLTGEPPFPGPAAPDYRQQHLTAIPSTIAAADPRFRSILAAGLRKPQAGRPSISRVQAVMRDVVANPPKASVPIAALHEINAVQAENRSKQAARAESERAASKARAEVVDAGEKVLKGIFARIEEIARENLSEARVSRSDYVLGLDISIGGATLQAQYNGEVLAMFPLSKWEPFAIGRIGVTQTGKHPTGQHEWQHAATLWYMRLTAKAEVRWYEASYKHNALAGGPMVGPFAIQDVSDEIYRRADEAAAPMMSRIELESRTPIAIDDENTEQFVERWLGRLAQAFHGSLRPF